MGIKQRRTDQEIIQRRAVETREKIMASAIDLYIEKGYHKATVDEIAKHAGVSTGIAYRYFKNKKELLLEALAFSVDKAWQNDKKGGRICESGFVKPVKKKV